PSRCTELHRQLGPEITQFLGFQIAAHAVGATDAELLIADEWLDRVLAGKPCEQREPAAQLLCEVAVRSKVDVIRTCLETLFLKLGRLVEESTGADIDGEPRAQPARGR